MIHTSRTFFQGFTVRFGDGFSLLPVTFTCYLQFHILFKDSPKQKVRLILDSEWPSKEGVGFGSLLSSAHFFVDH